VRVARDEVGGGRVDVREVAAPAAGNLYLPPDPLVVLQNDHAPPAPARLKRAHQPRRPAADYYHIDFHEKIIHMDGQD
jgi:hypothetical protein